MKQYYVYILGSLRGALYVGVTNNLVSRVHQHKTKINKSHTSKYNISRLLYYEVGEDITAAIKREKQLKKWKRAYKDRLITEFNPGWRDLYSDISQNF